MTTNSFFSRHSTISRWALVAAAGFFAAACSRSGPSLPALTPAAFAFPVDTLRTQRVADGVNHHFIYSRTGPWAIHVLDARLGGCVMPTAVKGAATPAGRIKTSEILRTLALSREVVGGVNADFFSLTTGVPTGAHVSDGKILTPPNGRPSIAIDSAGAPHIVTLLYRNLSAPAGDTVAWRHTPLWPFHPREAVGGRPILATDSVAAALRDTALFTAGRHPRTAVGIAQNGKRLLLVVVDGRQKPYSDGMTLPELARLMLALGARDALNLDGGGSTTMVYADPDSARALRIANHPSDKEGERAVGNALALVNRCAR